MGLAKKKSHITSGEKGNITKLFKQGLSVPDISDKTGITCTKVKLLIAKAIRGMCDELWSLIIRQVGKCEVSGKTDNLQAHHLLEKSAFPHLRYDLSNGICLTDDIHEFNRDVSPHSNSAARENFRLWLKENRPGQFQWWEENRHNKFTPDKALSSERMLEIYAELKAVYEKGLQNGKGQEIGARGREVSTENTV